MSECGWWAGNGSDIALVSILSIPSILSILSIRPIQRASPGRYGSPPPKNQSWNIDTICSNLCLKEGPLDP